MKIGIIGCGKQAVKHIEGFRANGVDDFVCYDLNPMAARAFAEKNRTQQAETLDQLFDDPDVRAIDICTPVSSHFELARRSINSGRPFFCEKPLTASLDEDRQLLAMSVEANVCGMVGYIYRFVPALELGKAVCDAGAIGNAHSAIFRVGGRGSHMAWKHQKASGGGALNEMAVHMIDLAYWYFGEMETVQLFDIDRRQSRRKIGGQFVDCDAEDWIVAKMVSKKGVNVLLQADLVTPAFTQYVEIQGDEGSFAGSIDPNYASYLHLTREWGKYKTGRNALDISPSNFYKAQMGMFAEVVQGGEPDRNTLSDSVAVMELQEQIRKQADSAFR